MVVGMLGATSPVFAYYCSGFLPAIPSMMWVIAGLCTYLYYRDSGKHLYWHLSIILLTLGALARTSQAVPLTAVLCFEALRIIRKESTLLNKIPTVLISLAVIGGYLLWNAHLRQENGTLFLNELRPPHSWEDIRSVKHNVQERWLYHYFSYLQHLLITLAVVAAAVFGTIRLFSKKEKVTAGSKTSLWILAAGWMLGECLFAWVMLLQFSDHDYYFLDSFFLPILFVFALALAAIPANFMADLALGTAFVLLGGVMFNNAKHNIAGRVVDTEDRALQCSENYAGADQWLDSVGVSRDAKILTILSYPQNAPFIMMGRKGFCMMSTGEEYANSVVTFPFDYVVIEDTAFERFYKKQENLLSRLHRIAGNGKLSLCTIADSTVNHGPDDFFSTTTHFNTPQKQY